MANTTLCDLYTKQFNEVSEAISNGLTSGQSYKIAGRQFESHQMPDLIELQGKLLTLMNRNCGSTCGIKTRRITPL